MIIKIRIINFEKYINNFLNLSKEQSQPFGEKDDKHKPQCIRVIPLDCALIFSTAKKSGAERRQQWSTPEKHALTISRDFIITRVLYGCTLSLPARRVRIKNAR